MSDANEAKKQQRQAERFREAARELGLDTDEANAAFERVFGTIAPPKKKGDKVPPKAKDDSDS
ncbi:hypothetical protein [Nitratireductor sp. StC3]|uniref:hypothetical protein n=1 Tax=Nitratireductor sp. StC3 TaxID=2126741 RepID=UPI000D0DAFBC|nr:hypothetical protein [Nitratireductor sp. StC3]PSM17793.1 hypothetical protein C7T96_12480 [Nitratireductor sp. StC3]